MGKPEKKSLGKKIPEIYLPGDHLDHVYANRMYYCFTT